jgi:hypothetical protein
MRRPEIVIIDDPQTEVVGSPRNAEVMAEAWAWFRARYPDTTDRLMIRSFLHSDDTANPMEDMT